MACLQHRPLADAKRLVDGRPHGGRRRKGRKMNTRIGSPALARTAIKQFVNAQPPLVGARTAIRIGGPEYLRSAAGSMEAGANRLSAADALFRNALSGPQPDPAALRIGDDVLRASDLLRVEAANLTEYARTGRTTSANLKTDSITAIEGALRDAKRATDYLRSEPRTPASNPLALDPYSPQPTGRVVTGPMTLDPYSPL